MGCAPSSMCGPSSPPPAQQRRARKRTAKGSSAARRHNPDYNMSKRNAEIEAGLMQARKAATAIKILLLGAGESGKSTVLKQMRLIHGTGFSNYERSQYTKVIWCDTVQSMRILIQQAGMMAVPLDCDSPQSALHQYKQLLLETDPLHVYDDNDDDGQQHHQQQQHNILDDYVVQYGNKYHQETLSLMANDESPSNLPKTKWQVAEAIHQLWRHDSGLQQVMGRANEFQLEVNARHYFDNVFQYAQRGYKATDTDILVGRIKTTGITETVFNVQGMNFRMFDVGGQRSERKKWIHCFDNVTAVLFVAAVSEYDQVLFEDARVNRMKEALVLFQSIVNSRWFGDTPIILFLNKTDILHDKLAASSPHDGTSFASYYPNFSGDSKNYKHVMSFLQKMFLACNKNPNRHVYVHHTCATDTASMKFVMQAVTDMILEQNMLQSGIM